jgi:uncharacterized membrane protein YkvA (DUF1232 family)
MDEYNNVEELNQLEINLMNDGNANEAIMKNRIEFVNKVYAGKNQKTGKSKLSIAAAVCFALVLLGGIIIAGGIGGISVSVLGLFLYNVTNVGNGKQDRYILASAIFELDENGVTLAHLLIDYDDKLGDRDEINQMRWTEVSNVYYSQNLASICIEGVGNKQIQWRSEKQKNRKARNKKIKQIILYTPVDRTEEFLNLIRSYGREIRYIE